MSALQRVRAPPRLILVDPLAVAVTYVIGAAVAFFWSAYARALRLNVPRWVFFVWPAALAALPFVVLWILHRRLEVYFAGGLVEERKATARMSVREIREHLEDD